ncbi:MAG: carboxypeptidase M32, partial [Burkholderiales bacterium]|nr:carboxypeptidase M32 [Opitutaceae bacterium]
MISSSAAYGELKLRLRRVHTLGSVVGLLGWDEQVNLPAGAAEQRAAQLSLIAELVHAEATASG